MIFHSHRDTIRLLLVGVMALAGKLSSSQAVEPAPLSAACCVAQPRVLVIAHRGDSKVAPENTLPAFASAVAARADLVELDYHHSAEGMPVVIHDGELDRTTNSVSAWGIEKTKVSSKRLAELQQLDAGSWFAPRFAGTRLPTLAQALATISAGSITLVERKSGDPAACVDLLARQRMLERAVVQAFDWQFLAGCHRLAPELVLGALGEKELTGAKLDEIANTGARIVAWSDKHTTAETIRAIHARGWKAWVWTVDDPRRINELAAAKIDGIITNRPALARRVLESIQPAP